MDKRYAGLDIKHALSAEKFDLAYLPSNSQVCKEVWQVKDCENILDFRTSVQKLSLLMALLLAGEKPSPKGNGQTAARTFSFPGSMKQGLVHRLCTWSMCTSCWKPAWCVTLFLTPSQPLSIYPPLSLLSPAFLPNCIFSLDSLLVAHPEIRKHVFLRPFPAPTLWPSQSRRWESKKRLIINYHSPAFQCM